MGVGLREKRLKKAKKREGRIERKKEGKNSKTGSPKLGKN